MLRMIKGVLSSVSSNKDADEKEIVDSEYGREKIEVEEREVCVTIQLLNSTRVEVPISSTSSVQSVLDAVVSTHMQLEDGRNVDSNRYSLFFRPVKNKYDVSQLQLDPYKAIGMYEKHPLFPLVLESSVLMIGFRSPCPVNADLIGHGVSVSIPVRYEHSCSASPAERSACNPFVLYCPVRMSPEDSLALSASSELLQAGIECIGATATAHFYEGPCVTVRLESLSEPSSPVLFDQLFQRTKVPSGMRSRVEVPYSFEAAREYRLTALSTLGAGIIVHFRTLAVAQ